MEQPGSLGESKRFGRFLRKIREGRKLSLDAVEEMSATFPERLTKSHLSRIENGQAEPSFRKLFALSQIYGMPLVSLAEQYELDLQRELVTVDTDGKEPAEVEAEALELFRLGRYSEALFLLQAMVDQLTATSSRDEETGDWIRQLKLMMVDCHVHLRRWELAKAEAEDVLSATGTTSTQRLIALQFFISSCYSLGRYTVARMGLDQAVKDLDAAEAPPRFRADFAALGGNLATVTGDYVEAVHAYASALRLYEELEIPFEVCRTRLNMASAMIQAGRLSDASEQLDAALLVAEASSYDRLRALAMSHMAVVAYKSGNLKTAESWAIRSNTLARSRDFVSLVFRNCYYLWRIALAREEERAVKTNERTLRALLGRVEGYLVEAEEFRAVLAGGES